MIHSSAFLLPVSFIISLRKGFKKIYFFIQAIYGKLKELGLNNFLANDSTFKEKIKEVLALAFLPPKMIETEFKRLKNEIENHVNNLKDAGLIKDVKPRVDTFLKYYERYWIKIIKPEGYSIYGLSKRTNNCTESLNAILAEELGIRPPPALSIR